MGKNITMKARDTIAAKLAECFVTIGTRRYNFMQMIDCEWKVEKTKASVPRLGAIMVGHKSCGMEGTFSGPLPSYKRKDRRRKEPFGQNSVKLKEK